MGTAISLVILHSTVNLLVFFYWYPSDDTQRIIAEMGTRFPVSWELMLILDSSIRWYFFFAVWAALYVALGYANEMRAVERRANAYRLEAQNAQLRALHYQRSEEHTSELQSLMRIPYAVFRLKKKN